MKTDALRLLHGAADDPAQDVPAPLVRRRDAVSDEERHPAAVVREDAMRPRRCRRVAVRDARLGRDPFHDLPVAVCLVHRANVLEDRRAALEAETGVDVLFRQRRQRAVGVLLVRHEHEVPELEEAVAAWAGGRTVRLAAPVLRDPSPSRSRSPARTVPARRPTRSSPPSGAARSARSACRPSAKDRSRPRRARASARDRRRAPSPIPAPSRASCAPARTRERTRWRLP